MLLNTYSKEYLTKLNTALCKEVKKLMISKSKMLQSGNIIKAEKLGALISEVSILHENLSIYLRKE
jgi:hypothetical protein